MPEPYNQERHEVPRVLHCIPNMGGGGAERQLTYLSESLIQSGWDVHVALRGGGSNMARLQASGASVHTLGGRNARDPRFLFEIVRTIRQVRPAVVQTWLGGTNIAGAAACALTGTPHVMTERNSGAAYPFGVRWALRGIASRAAAAIVANSAQGAAYWRRRGARADRVHQIANAVPIDEIQRASLDSAAARLRATLGEIVIFAGRFDEQKNVHRLVSALHEVMKQQESVTAVLFGEGQLLGEVKTVVASLGRTQRILMPGFTDVLWAWMREASVYVSVSLYEGQPNAVLEAAAARCPLVLSDIPEHRDLFSGDSAFYVSATDESDIASGLREALRAPEIRQARAAKAFTRVQDASVEAMCAQYVDVYRRAVREASGVRA